MNIRMVPDHPFSSNKIVSFLFVNWWVILRCSKLVLCGPLNEDDFRHCRRTNHGSLLGPELQSRGVHKRRFFVGPPTRACVRIVIRRRKAVLRFDWVPNPSLTGRADVGSESYMCRSLPDSFEDQPTNRDDMEHRYCIKHRAKWLFSRLMPHHLLANDCSD